MENFVKKLQEFFVPNADNIVRVPVLVKGKLLFPPEISLQRLQEYAHNISSQEGISCSFMVDNVQVIRQPIVARSTLTPTGKYQFLLFASPNPQELIEKNCAQLAEELYNLPFSEFLNYIKKLRDFFLENQDIIRRGAATSNNVSFLDDRMVELLFAQIPALLDPEALENAVDRELCGPEGSGRKYLDGWIEIASFSHRGITGRMRDYLFPPLSCPQDIPFVPKVRAIPTRQLHITAGNSPLLTILSFLRGLATKGAMVIKSPMEVTAISAILAIGMTSILPEHPITRHTSLVYWKGGDTKFENALFAPGAFDRIVVWGTPETVESVRSRVHYTKTIFLNPRYGISLIGKEAFPNHYQEIAARACSDSMIGNQRACTASLVHYVVSDEEQTLDYCRALQKTLAEWDRKLPHSLSRATIGSLRMLRRKEFFRGQWFENGKDMNLTSVVIYMPTSFDISLHPMCRCIIVRRLERPEDILPFLSSSVSTIGVFPETLRYSLVDRIASAGVSNILPLGDCERAYAGMPHDGMRILGELVNWTNG